jgi:hypothetical protein
MKIFERITFPTSAIYNIQAKNGCKIVGEAKIDLQHANNIVYIDVSKMTIAEAEKSIDDVIKNLQNKNDFLQVSDKKC